ncbi:specifically androgen-regulated gene protein [Erinaceus europaeus]|uniref:Specifically androgen-regulated gene protein n=1 Tax=Erinaceus europaeus TaxID=9365 RepID=A0A1S3WLF5_ERIEU|nr:specifically androgen-regulated gene protein [Erinaceus europaeus]
MPEREPWPVGPGPGTDTQLSSHASMTSTTSTRSGPTDSSYDFLSADEKACLLFLEETIGSLDKEADCGLSADESEPAGTPRGPPTLPPGPPAPQAPPEEPRNVTWPQSQGFWSGSHSLPRNIHIGRSQHLRRSSTQKAGHTPEGPERPVPAPEKGQGGQSGHSSRAPAAPPLAVPADPALIPPPEAFRDTQPELWGGPGEQRLTTLRPLATLATSPPCNPALAPPERRGPSAETMSQKASGDGHPMPPATPAQELAGKDHALGADARLTTLGTPKPRKLPPNIVLKSSRASFHGEPQSWLSRPAERAPADGAPVSSALKEQRRARREALQKLGLPQDLEEPSAQPPMPNSSMRPREPRGPAQASATSRPVTGQPGFSAAGEGHPAGKATVQGPAPGRLSSAAQGPSPARTPSPAQGPSPARASSPAQGPVPGKASSPAQRPSPSRALSPAQGPVPGKASSPAQGPVPGKASSPSQRPVPGKVSSPAQGPTSGKGPEVRSLPVPIPKAPRVDGVGTLAKLDPGLTLQASDTPGLRQMSFKSNTLERSGVGLSSYLSAKQEPGPQTSSSLGKGSVLGPLSPIVPRSSRPRPASLGTGKDFEGIPVGRLADLEQEQSSLHRPYAGQSRAQLPRAPCVSVRISPKGIHEEHRREALRKLGLLKD